MGVRTIEFKFCVSIFIRFCVSPPFHFLYLLIHLYFFYYFVYSLYFLTILIVPFYFFYYFFVSPLFSYFFCVFPSNFLLPSRNVIIFLSILCLPLIFFLFCVPIYFLIVLCLPLHFLFCLFCLIFTISTPPPTLPFYFFLFPFCFHTILALRNPHLASLGFLTHTSLRSAYPATCSDLASLGA